MPFDKSEHTLAILHETLETFDLVFVRRKGSIGKYICRTFRGCNVGDLPVNAGANSAICSSEK